MWPLECNRKGYGCPLTRRTPAFLGPYKQTENGIVARGDSLHVVSSKSKCRLTGAKLRRCSSQGPRSSRRCRWNEVAYPLWRRSEERRVGKECRLMLTPNLSRSALL